MLQSTIPLLELMPGQITTMLSSILSLMTGLLSSIPRSSVYLFFFFFLFEYVFVFTRNPTGILLSCIKKYLKLWLLKTINWIRNKTNWILEWSLAKVKTLLNIITTIVWYMSRWSFKDGNGQCGETALFATNNTRSITGSRCYLIFPSCKV